MENLVKENLQQFYSGRKIFLTGHTGFKGSWLAAWLFSMGASVKGYALEPGYKKGLFDVLGEDIFETSVIADIRDRKKLADEIQSFQPDLVFHLAAQPLVRRSYEIPSETFDINVTGTANVLEAVKYLEKKCAMVVITTDKVYENLEQDILYKESSNLGGYDPYSASKACTELVVSSFRNSFFNSRDYTNHQKSLASARAGNVIGGGDWSNDRIVPDIVRALKQNQEIILRNPNAIRPWQHVLEPLSGYLILGMKLYKEPEKFATAYNFGPLPEDHLTVQQLVENAIASWGSGRWKDASLKDQPHEAGILKLDINKAKAELNWVPKLNAEKAIDWTIKWYQQDVNKLKQFTFGQIKDFIAL